MIGRTMKMALPSVVAYRNLFLLSASGASGWLLILMGTLLNFAVR